MWLILMLIILLTNGMSSFGLKVLSAWGISSSIKYQYLTIWYAAGALCIAIPMVVHRTRSGKKEALWAAAIALLSLGGQLSMANALAVGLPGSIVFPTAIGGSILVVALAGRLFFSEKLHPLSWAGCAVGLAAVVLLSVS
jgi:drug/metabolite transporter (DMT)-like permease